MLRSSPDRAWSTPSEHPRRVQVRRDGCRSSLRLSRPDPPRCGANQGSLPHRPHETTDLHPRWSINGAPSSVSRKLLPSWRVGVAARSSLSVRRRHRRGQAQRRRFPLRRRQPAHVREDLSCGGQFRAGAAGDATPRSQTLTCPRLPVTFCPNPSPICSRLAGMVLAPRRT